MTPFGLFIHDPRGAQNVADARFNYIPKLAFPFIPFAELGLFNGLWAKEEKKSLVA
jgi:hypothetical protein